MTLTNGTANADAQRSILGCLLLDYESFMKYASSFDIELFTEPHLIGIAEAAYNLMAEDEKVDIVTISNELENMGKLNDVGGPEYLAILQNEVPVTTHLPQYLQIARHGLACRKIKETLKLELSELGSKNARQTISNIKESIQEIEKGTVKIEKPKSVLELLELAAKQDLESPAPKTPFRYLNTILNAKTPRAGHLWILGAYQKVGKSSMSIQLAHAWVTQGKTIRFISLEMAETELATRFHRYNHVAENPMPDKDYSRFVISELKAPSIEQVLHEINTCEEEIIFVDYLQIISSKVDELKAMEKMPMQLKNGARLSGKTIVALSQTGNEAAVNPTRKKSPFKGSANIGAAADLGIALYRDLDEEAQVGGDYGEAKLDVILNRHGEQGVCYIAFNRKTGFFEDKKVNPGFSGEKSPEVVF